MKKFIITFSLVFSLTSSFAQVPKKVVAEHFTNTICGICAARNPGFYANLDNFPAILHLAVHPSSPYAACVLSQHNVTENNSRTNYYGIFGGTPRIVIQGSVIPTNATYSDPLMFSPFTGQTSPASIKITQTKYGNDSIRSRIRIKTEGAHSLGNLRLFISLAEDTVFYTAPNGETKHHDVFRKSLGGAQGITVNLPSTIGDSLIVSMSSTVHPAWNFSRIFTMAILQEESNKAVVQAEGVLPNSGTLITNIRNSTPDGDVGIFPNPASGTLFIRANPEKASRFRITDGHGRTSITGEFRSYQTIDVSALTTGVYFITIENDKGKVCKKFVKE